MPRTSFASTDFICFHWYQIKPAPFIVFYSGIDRAAQAGSGFCRLAPCHVECTQLNPTSPTRQHVFLWQDSGVSCQCPPGICSGKNTGKVNFKKTGCLRKYSSPPLLFEEGIPHLWLGIRYSSLGRSDWQWLAVQHAGTSWGQSGFWRDRHGARTFGGHPKQVGQNEEQVGRTKSF